MVRTFIAVELPDEIRAKISGIQQTLGLKSGLVSANNVHLTMKFLGDVQDAKVEKIKKALDGIKVAPFQAHVKGVGVFPNLGYIRIIWAGIAEGAEQFVGLSSAVESALVPLGFAKEKKFTPHATIARVKSVVDKAVLIAKIKELTDAEFGTFTVDEVKLKKSTLTPKGAIYEDLKVKSLG
jgi:2'-5' RNA ligase